MPAKKKVKKEGVPAEADEMEESELPEAEGSPEGAVAEQRQLTREELEDLRRRLQEKFH
jgi:hypothetical protein